MNAPATLRKLVDAELARRHAIHAPHCDGSCFDGRNERTAAEIAVALALIEERDGLAAEVATHRADLEAAAGELPVPIPAPSTIAAQLLRANGMMRRDRDRAEERSRLHAADANRAAERWSAANARVAALEMERDAALRQREELTRALRAAQAIVEGRTVAPTPAEAHAHNVATGRRGWWLVTTDAGTGLFALDGVDGRITYARRSNDAPWVAVDNGSDAQWSVKRAVPLDAEGRPCAWPVAPEVPA